MNQISEGIYFSDIEKWARIAHDEGGLEICDDKTGQPLYVIGAQF
ncbi:hypothetical protein [Levilactobacillus enshiensis]|nr:hypothetical protein [Levilactobacillus enshiensis]